VLISLPVDVVLTILALVRNFVPAHEMVVKGDWNVAAVAKDSYDLENKVVGTVAVGRIGERVLRRLRAVRLQRAAVLRLPALRARGRERDRMSEDVDTLDEMLAQCDVVTINCPLHEKTRGHVQQAADCQDEAWYDFHFSPVPISMTTSKLFSFSRFGFPFSICLQF
jgi:formate dehydrogenase